MPLEIDQEIVRRNEANFRLLDDRNITGGLHTVVNVAARNSILSSLRKAGMLCWVQTPPTMYQLANDLTTWTVFSGGGGGSVVTVTGNDPIWVDNTDPANPIIGPVASATAGAVIISDGTLFSQRRITYDDIDAAFAINSFSPTFSTSAELGTTLVNPAFTASYNAAIVSASLDDGVVPLPINLPAVAFGYNNAGASGLPAKSYQKLVINGIQSWILGAIKAPAGPSKAATVNANLGLTRRYFDIVPVPGVYDELFIKSLGTNQLASGRSGSYVFGAGTPLTKIYLCWPTAFGDPTSIQGPVPFAFPMVKVATAVPFTNTVAPGFVIPGGYDVWESANFIISPFTVVVV